MLFFFTIFFYLWQMCVRYLHQHQLQSSRKMSGFFRSLFMCLLIASVHD